MIGRKLLRAAEIARTMTAIDLTQSPPLILDDGICWQWIRQIDANGKKQLYTRQPAAWTCIPSCERSAFADAVHGILIIKGEMRRWNTKEEKNKGRNGRNPLLERSADSHNFSSRARSWRKGWAGWKSWSLSTDWRFLDWNISYILCQQR